MADWIKVETTSSQKIEVLTIADLLDMDEHMVFGKLVILWCWADANTVDGNARNVTKRMIDRVTCTTGFADAMLHETVQWLNEDENGTLSFSNFDRHNGKGAKKRATTARRVKDFRNSVTEEKEECNTASVTENEQEALPEKIREDKNNKLDFTPLLFSVDEIKEFKLLRSKKKAAVTQRVINEHAKQFDLSRARGYTNDDILSEWSNRGWTAYKDEWMKVSVSKKQDAQKVESFIKIDEDALMLEMIRNG